MPKKKLQDSLSLFCPVCGKQMQRLSYEEGIWKFPMNYCEKCDLLYDLLTDADKKTNDVRELILYPKPKEWLVANKKHLKVTS